MERFEPGKQNENETEENQVVILLPDRSITLVVEGESGTIYHSVLVDDPQLGRLTSQVLK
mgnify:CR=1 FL=1